MSKKKRKDVVESDKLVIKADVLAKYLCDFNFSEDFECMQFTSLYMSSKKIESLNNAILEVKHVKIVDFSNNNIVDPTLLQGFEFLIHLNLNGNKVKTLSAFATEDGFPRLRKLELANNKLSDLVPIVTKSLEYFDITSNKIEKYDSWNGHPSIKIFKAVDNKFKNLSIIKDMPNLTTAYLAMNPITSFSGYENVGNLKFLHLRTTKIDKIDEELPEMPAIEHINLRETKIASLANLKNIFQFGSLRNLNIVDTPLETDATSFNMLLAEVIILYHGLVKFCKVTITEQHKYESLYLSEYRWRKAEEERKRKEEEEKQKAEGEGDS